MVRRTQLIRVAVGTIFLLSTTSLFFFLYSYQSGGGRHESSFADDGRIENPHNNVDSTLQDATPKEATTIVSWKTVTTTETKTASNAICTKPDTRLTAEDLDVEQIEADFPNGYKNPRDWFKTPATPSEQEYLGYASEDEIAALSEIQAEAQASSKRLDRITSFYGMDRMGTWNDHIESLDSDGLAPLCVLLTNTLHDVCSLMHILTG